MTSRLSGFCRTFQTLPKTQAEGTAEKAAGKVQNTVGGAKDAVRDTLKK